MAIASAHSRSGRGSDLTANLVAFVIDEATRGELAGFCDQLGISGTHIARGGLDAVIEYLGRATRPPERLIVDISGLAQPLAELDQLAQACDPSVLVYVLGEKNDVTLYRALLQMGVRDYRYKPVTLDAFRSWLEDDVSQPVRRARTGKIIAVTGTRGGVGVTTLAVNLARQLTLGRGQRRVILLDGDFYGGTAATLLGMNPNHALTELLLNIERLEPQVLERTLTTEDNRLFLLGAQQNHAEAFALDNGMMRSLLEALSQHYHYVVVDLARAGGTMGNDVFSVASTACLITDRSIFSVRQIARIAMHIEARSRAPSLQVVLNASRPHVRGQLEAREFQQAIPKPLAMEITYDGKHVPMAEDLGEPLPASCEMAQATVRLAAMITGEDAGKTVSRRKGGWFRRSA
ncbi:MAG: AAA family ATPase [Castellaniella sp.]